MIDVEEVSYSGNITSLSYEASYGEISLDNHPVIIKLQEELSKLMEYSKYGAYSVK